METATNAPKTVNKLTDNQQASKDLTDLVYERNTTRTKLEELDAEIKQQIITMNEMGITQSNISKISGMSRQRVYQILDRG